MTTNPEVTRTVELDIEPDELWALVSEGDGWEAWLVDEAEVEVRPGGCGVVVDDGEIRHVEVDEVHRTRGVRFRWWPADAPEQVSRVELLVVEVGARTALRIRETLPLAQASTDVRWGVRGLVLSVRASGRCRT